jgi:protein phosphatase
VETGTGDGASVAEETPGGTQERPEAARRSSARRRPPREGDVDYFGVTHRGHVRTSNQDQFLIASLHKQLRVHSTSLPRSEHEQLTTDVAGLLMVADGVGGLAGGEEASGATLDALKRYVTYTMEAFRQGDSEREAHFLMRLHDSVMRAHKRVLSLGSRDPTRAGMATTLTLAYIVWPKAYVIQVGDSRCYHLRDGELLRVTRDQTLVEELVAEGVLEPEEAEASQLRSILSSAIGGPVANPVTTRAVLSWQDQLMLCTDGLTKHVSDEEIGDTLRASATAEEGCQQLLQLALDRGGRDNVTVVIVRLREGSAPDDRATES